MKQAHEYQHDEHRVHLIIYHLIWCPRRRKPVLVGPVAARCRELIAGRCAEHGWEILALAIQPDHIHVFVRATPSDSAAEVVKECQGITSFSLRREFPHLLKLPSMWTRRYLASTAGHVSQQTIQRYIRFSATLPHRPGASDEREPTQDRQVQAQPHALAGAGT